METCLSFWKFGVVMMIYYLTLNLISLCNDNGRDVEPEEWSEEQDQVEQIGRDWSVLEFLQMDESVKKLKHNLHMSLHLGFKGQMQ